MLHWAPVQSGRAPAAWTRAPLTQPELCGSRLQSCSCCSGPMAAPLSLLEAQAGLHSALPLSAAQRPVLLLPASCMCIAFFLAAAVAAPAKAALWNVAYEVGGRASLFASSPRMRAAAAAAAAESDARPRFLGTAVAFWGLLWRSED